MSKQNLVEVTLSKPHRHAGTDHPAGTRLKVTLSQRAFLAERNKITAPAEPKAKAEPAAKA